MEKVVRDIVYGISLQKVIGSTEVTVEALTLDSRNAGAGSLFFAVAGTRFDGHDFIAKVIEQGCRVIIAEKEVAVPEGVTLIVTENSHKATGIVASNFYGEPSRQLKLVGITGTNGKTTTTTLLYNLFMQLGYKTGLLSTVVNKIGAETIPSTHTTPDPIALNALLAQMVDANCEYCFMEVSSHAIHQYRIAGLEFAGGVFTNITHDHLDYHNTFKEYLDVKKRFFDELPVTAFALTNIDDKNGRVMIQNTRAKVVTYAMKSPADYKVKVLENQFSGLVLNINGKEVWSRLVGDFNAYNLLTAYAVSILLGEEEEEVLRVLSSLESVEGRFQYFISESGVVAIIDYAHTPDALENVLKTIANIRTKNETLYTIVGCGGDRDKAKRPEMARIACELSDKVILTSDNPRSEDPNQIIEEMNAGVPGYHFKKTISVVDRKQAIKTAISMAEKGDIILIAGKGHEKYQEINGIKYDFDDRQIALELFEQMM
ncbi:UDP-N-acetylmuramoyl-L-alanyl-D-glutamate--2,6-diaminopimelate ligase [Crocinitomicaceae bacterium CZZ-1]|uniref:UDP-N-acetylmuramoyl-L-alanyl-D-glutamate--2,6-diaminopimelate ligase n=1 Tax=Taishania pollutisoli TaxID=2766479 RepID=A0A8J6P7V2_9FLAO|nr:UDP-N-acetylmuramoyl-L-alanyl-D-glutamate--2,6-diaminopimelate ligase [Taishania pollutisoli]MBC9813684.1 UDP-N-acetylmuramoyl-L-alanyl-D-glutamate--2,6-diaminopimelate ligase [Taishania pollutisoli]